jgi:UDP-N-acetylmuramate dehydrogenase
VQLSELFLQTDEIVIDQDCDLTNFSTMKLKASGDLITVKSVEALKEVQRVCSENNISPVVLGLGANQLIKSHSSRPYLKLHLPFEKAYLEGIKDQYTFPASVPLAQLTAHAIKYSLKGWEVFTGIPATIGGAVFMNAGTSLGETGSLIKSVKVVTKQGEEKEIAIDESSFSYRKNNFLSEGDIIFSVEMIHHGIDQSVSALIKKYLQKRVESQPLNQKTCGCVFKNKKNGKTCHAGQYIDIMGLKGFTLGDIRVSPVHANFLENVGQASYEDVQKSISFIRDELRLQFGLSFDTEVRI